MKTLTLNKSVFTLMSVIMATLILMSCSKEEIADRPMTIPDTEGYSKTLNAAEQDGLLYLAEKEKMMRNAYESMDRALAVTVFNTNSDKKAQHMGLLSAKIDKYGLENPIENLGYAEFHNPLIQESYDDFVALDEMSVTEAVAYSKALEESTINELEQLISEVKGNDDLIVTYRQILEESKANLEALVFGTKGLIDIAVWYDPIKVFVPERKGVRDIILVYNTVKED